jgi:hypothetical protein
VVAGAVIVGSAVGEAVAETPLESPAAGRGDLPTDPTGGRLGSKRNKPLGNRITWGYEGLPIFCEGRDFSAPRFSERLENLSPRTGRLSAAGTGGQLVSLGRATCSPGGQHPDEKSPRPVYPSGGSASRTP